MEQTLSDIGIDRRIAARLKALRAERGWSLDELARRSGVSRATLSRLENAEVSATASALGRLCAAHELSMSRLMHMVEEADVALVRHADQMVWTDAEAGFRRRSVSPPSPSLAGEGVLCALDPGARIDYERPPRQGLEHHLLLLEGALTVTLGEEAHELGPGDCLRYRLTGPSRFETPPDTAVLYVLFMV